MLPTRTTAGTEVDAPAGVAVDAAAASAEVPTDLRLLAPAVGAEVGAVLGLLLSGRSCVAVVLVALIAALIVGVGSGRRRGVSVLLALLLVLAGSAAGAALRAETRRSGPVADTARAEQSAAVQVVLTGDPKSTRAAVAGDALRRASVTIPARLELLHVGARAVRTRAPVLLLAPADGWSGLLPSQHVALSGKLVVPRGSDLTAVVLVRGAPESVGPPSESQRLAGSLRSGLRRACARLPADARGLLPGLVVGDTTDLPADLADDARTSGLSHLTAVSGANCAIVLALVLALVRPTRLGRRGRSVVAFVGLVGFVILARPSPSVLRAALMGGIALLALALGRQRAAVPALLGAAMLLVLADPDLALDPGFALSVLATGSLLLVAPAWADAFARRLPRWAAELLAIPLAAQVAVTPVVVLLSGSISLAAVPANLLAAPAVPVATVLGVLVVVLAPFAAGAAAHVATIGGWPCSWIAAVAHRMAHVKGGSLAWPQTGLGAVLALLAVAAVVAAVRRRRGRRLLIAAVCGIVLAALLVPRTLPSWPLPGWRMLACDVGQGDALLLRGNSDEPPVLVDAGPDPRPLRDCLGRLGIRRLSAVVLSHLHADHVEGLPAVLGRVSVPVVFVNPLDEPALEGRRVRGWAAKAGAPVTVLQAGQHLTAGGVSLDVVAPVRVLHGTESDPNNDSLVLFARAGGLSVLMTGDVEPEGQAALLDRGVPHVDVLKVPHHGSAHQDDRFLAATGARVAVASVGRDNPYGHPSGRTLQTLARQGMVAMRTDLDGGVALAPAGGSPRVLPERSNSRPALEAAPLVRMQDVAALQTSGVAPARALRTVLPGADPTLRAQGLIGTPRTRARSPPLRPRRDSHPPAVCP